LAILPLLPIWKLGFCGFEIGLSNQGLFGIDAAAKPKLLQILPSFYSSEARPHVIAGREA